MPIVVNVSRDQATRAGTQRYRHRVLKCSIPVAEQNEYTHPVRSHSDVILAVFVKVSGRHRIGDVLGGILHWWPEVPLAIVQEHVHVTFEIVSTHQVGSAV